MTLQISHESIMIFPLMPENANDRRATVLQQGAGPGSGPIWSKKLPNFLCLFDTKSPTEIELLA